MPYNDAIPQPTDRIKSSQNDILQNFESIYTLVGVNHVNFDDISGNQGKHNVVAMPNYSPSGSPAAAAGEMKLFTKAVSGTTQLFLLPSTTDALTPERNISGATRAQTGECTLPSGIKLKWGASSTASPSGLATIIFLTPFATTYTVSANIGSDIGNPGITGQDLAIRVYNWSATDFSVVSYNFSNVRQQAPFTWLAIGI